jgi:hypothetical protein
MYSFKYNQQDATLYNILYYCQCSLHVSGGFSARHQELKNCTHSIWYVPGLLAATASVVGFLHVSRGFSAYHQEIKNCTHTASGTCQACLLLPLAWLGSSPNHSSGSSSKPGTYSMLCVVLELLMMGGEIVRNMKSVDNNNEYCITLHLVGCT